MISSADYLCIDLFLDLEMLGDNYGDVLGNSHVSRINVTKGISCTAA